jgi:hypothetical protein
LDAARDRDATACAMDVMKETILADLAKRNPVVVFCKKRKLDCATRIATPSAGTLAALWR